MKSVFSIVIVALTFLSAYSQLNGTWNLDWQSQGSDMCAPVSFTITNNSQDQSNATYIITYTYTAASSDTCPQNFDGNYSSNLTLVSSGVYNDSHNFQLTYENQAIFGVFSESPKYLYAQNGSYIPQDVALGPIGGLWADGKLINATNSSQCCVPDSFFLFATAEPGLGSQLNIRSTFTSSCTPNNRTAAAGSVTVPNLYQVNWTAYSVVSLDITSFIYDPYSAPNQITTQFGYINATNPDGELDFCTYSYQKTTENATLINGIWKLDWQTPETEYPTTFEVTNVNNSFMTSNLTYDNGTISSSYFMATGMHPNEYFDAHTQLFCMYNTTSNTFLTESPLLLYTQNGSYLADTMYESYWDSPQSTTGTPLSSSCCLPDWLHITPGDTANTWKFEYYLPTNFLEIAGCTAIAIQTSSNQVEGDLTLIPSVTQLKWQDSFGSTIYFGSSTSEVIVNGFADGPEDCNFKMEFTASQPPLSSSWISIDIKSILLLTVMMMIAYLN